jgi:hypothetical protein
VTATVKVRDAALKTTEEADVLLLLSEGRKTNAPVRAVYDRVSQSFSADLLPPSGGSFIVTAAATLKGKTLGDDRQLLVCEAGDREMEDLRARPALMATVARTSGGKSFTLDQAGAAQLSSLVSPSPAAVSEYRRTPLWDKWWWLGSILGLLTVEWSLRRLNGLA